MDLKRSLYLGIGVYVVILLGRVLFGWIANVNYFAPSDAPIWMWIVLILISLIAVFCFSIAYFKKAAANTHEGVRLGMMFVAIHFVIDTLILLPLLIANSAPPDYLGYYTYVLFWIFILLQFGTAVLTGWWCTDELSYV